MSKQEQAKIYYRPLQQWIDVTPEFKKEWERDLDTLRKFKKRHHECRIPYDKFFICDGLCDTCWYRCTPENHLPDLSIETELKRIEEGTSSYSGFLSDEQLVSEIDENKVCLNEIMATLKEKNPEGYQILMLCYLGYSERQSAEIMNLARNTFVSRRNKLFKYIKTKF